MKDMIIGHEPISMYHLKKWGYCPFDNGREYFVNWNGVWLKQVEDGVFEHGSPNHYTIDDEHPFVKKGEVMYMDDLNSINGTRGLEYKTYNYAWK